MSDIEVLFTRTYDGDYIADFSCNESDLPRTSTFGYRVITDAELQRLRSAASEADALRAERDDAERRLHLANDELVAIQTKVCAIHTEDILTKIDALARQIETAREMLKIISSVENNHMDFGARECRLCGHHHIHDEKCHIKIIDAWLAANAPTPAPEAEHPALLTEDGYFTNWPTEDEMPAPEAEQERTVIDAFADGM